jgi:hypothetical protein
MDADQPRLNLPLGPWAGIALLTALWIVALAVIADWWEPVLPRYDMTARVRGVPAGAAADARWLAGVTRRLAGHRWLLQAAESLGGAHPSPTAAELAEFRDALEIGVRQDAASGGNVLVLHYAGDLSQGPTLVELLARRFAASQVPGAALPVDLTDASNPGIDFRAWAVGLMVVLAVCFGGWCLAWRGCRDRPLTSADQAQGLLGVPVLAVDWRR